MPLPRPLAERLRTAGFLKATGAPGHAVYLPLTSADLDDRFNTAVIVSIIVHLVFIFGLTFKAANPALLRNVQDLEVVLVNARSLSKPLKPEVLAQASLDGGGEVEEDRLARSPLPASERDSPASAETLAPRISALEDQARQMLAQAKAEFAIPPPRPVAPAEPRPPAPPAPVDLAAASLEMARLMGQIDADFDAYQKRPRRAFVGARAQEYSYARYVEDWRMKVERIGNLNYPEAARRERIHGVLVLTASIRADGSLETVQIDRSSGHKVLDAAAVKIVEMSAPFAPFSADMRKQVDILSITRAWQFTSSDQLLSK